MGRRACTTGLRGGERTESRGGAEKWDRILLSVSHTGRGAAESRHCNPGLLWSSAQSPRNHKGGKNQEREMCGLYEGQLGRQAGQPPHHGARMPREGACNWLLHYSVPQFPLQQSEERRQEPGSAAIPALAELRCPHAGSHRARAQNPARSRSSREAPGRHRAPHPLERCSPIPRRERGS